MKVKDFYELVELNREPEASLLPNLQYRIKKYPYFQPDIFIYIKCLYLCNSESFAEELTRLAPFVSDRKALFYYVMNDQYRQFQQKVEKKLTADRTNLLINAFFETQDETLSSYNLFGGMTDSLNLASVDYFSYLDVVDQETIPQIVDAVKDDDVAFDLNSYIPTEEFEPLDTKGEGNEEREYEENCIVEQLEEDGIPVLKHQDIIDRFIAKAATEDSLRIKFEPQEDDNLSEDELDDPMAESSQLDLENDFFFTQTLANIYIKQKKYGRAYEIIKHLSLNYPEKNIYFADQLSFLEKLIKNTNINK